MITELERRLTDAFHEDAQRAHLTNPDKSAEAHPWPLSGTENRASGHRWLGAVAAATTLTVVAEPRSRRSGQRWLVAAACTALVVAGVVAVAQRPVGGPEPAATNPATTPSSVPADTAAPLPPPAPFVGVWVSTDTDGSSQTMEIVRSGTDEYEVVVRDDAATGACAGGAATMTGSALLETDERLVIAQPELTCDDGTTPSIGPPPQADIADFTFDRDPVADELADRFGVVWQREGSNVDLDGPATSPPTAGGMWPQSTLEEVRAAQERADAGDADYAWQVGAQLLEDDPNTQVELELIDRFLREELGWEAYLFYDGGNFSDWVGAGMNGWVEGTVTDQRYLRCAPGRTNPLYPPGPEPEMGELCAPTIDDLRYESVSVDIAQLDRQGRDGIWVVSRWGLTAPFAQADPVVVEAQGTQRLEEFLAARIAGEGAEGHVQVDNDVEVPLLYATTSGAPYERYEIERVDGPRWPAGWMTFSVRLLADGDATVVEQEIRWVDGLRLDLNSTTENGQPVVLSFTSSDGEVTVSAPSTWKMWWPEAAHVADVGVWFGGLWRSEDSFGSGERIEFVDPVAYDLWCAANGGSPLLSAPADAAAIAEKVIADPNFETTTPVAARVGGLEAVSIDVALAPSGRACGVGMIDISRWIHALWEPGWRLRLYLVDLPEGMSVETLAITVVAPQERFDDVIAETAPIIESIEFHPPAP